MTHGIHLSTHVDYTVTWRLVTFSFDDLSILALHLSLLHRGTLSLHRFRTRALLTKTTPVVERRVSGLPAQSESHQPKSVQPLECR